MHQLAEEREIAVKADEFFGFRCFGEGVGDG